AWVNGCDCRVVNEYARPCPVDSLRRPCLQLILIVKPGLWPPLDPSLLGVRMSPSARERIPGQVLDKIGLGVAISREPAPLLWLCCRGPRTLPGTCRSKKPSFWIC